MVSRTLAHMRMSIVLSMRRLQTVSNVACASEYLSRPENCISLHLLTVLGIIARNNFSRFALCCGERVFVHCAGAEASLSGTEQQWTDAMKALDEKLQVQIANCSRVQQVSSVCCCKQHFSVMSVLNLPLSLHSSHRERGSDCRLL